MILLNSIFDSGDAIVAGAGALATLLTAIGFKHWLPSLFNNLFGTECKKEVSKLKLQLVEIATALEMYIASQEVKNESAASAMLHEIIDKIKAENLPSKS